MNNLPAPDIVTSGMWITLLKSAAMLCVVLGVLLAVLFVIKRLVHGQGASAKHGLIKVMSSYYISPKEKILLLDVMGEKILIGATAQAISRLGKIKDFKGLDLPEPVEKNGNFLEMLKGKMTIGNKNRIGLSKKPSSGGSLDRNE